MIIGVLSDTHAPRRWRHCPTSVARNLEHVDLILHAGDVCTPEVLAELERFAPVRAVLGNNDGPDITEWGAPETDEFELEDVRFAMIHDAGHANFRVRRMRERFSKAQVVVYGHSHIPNDESEDGLRIFNPGSPTDKRLQPHHTMGLMEVTAGEIRKAQILIVDE